MFVAADLGASSTRYVSNNGTIRVLLNNMEFLSVDDVVDMELNDQSIEHALEVVISHTGGDEQFNAMNYPKKLLIGEMAERYNASNLRPNNMMKKSDQPLNYYSGVMAVAMSKMYNPDNKEAVDLYLAFPPIECTKDNKDAIEKKFKGRYSVEFVKLGKTVEFEISKVYIYEESFMAVLSYFFDMNGNIRKEASGWLKGNILSLDIGDSTTDFVLVQNGKYMNRSGQTYRVGGNFVTQRVASAVSREYGYEVPIETARQIVAEGRIQAGNGWTDARKIVDKAKRDFAKQLRGNIQTYFTQVGIPLQTIRAIVVSGGGSMKGEYHDENGMPHTTSESMSKFITDELKDVCAGVEVLDYGDKPRMANASGLFIRAMVNESKKQKENA